MRAKILLYLTIVLQSGWVWSQFNNRQPEVLKAHHIKTIKIYTDHPSDSANRLYLKSIHEIDSNGLLLGKRDFSYNDSVNYTRLHEYTYDSKLQRQGYVHISRRQSKAYDTTFYYQDSTYLTGDTVFFMEKTRLNDNWTLRKYAIQKKNCLRQKISQIELPNDSLIYISRTFFRPLRKSQKQTNKYYHKNKLNSKSIVKLRYNSEKQLIEYDSRFWFQLYLKPSVDKYTLTYLENGLIDQVVWRGESETKYIYSYIKH